jgi:MFS family permease
VLRGRAPHRWRHHRSAYVPLTPYDPAPRQSQRLLGGAFATFLISSALMHAYAVFLVAFLEDFRWSRADASLAYAVSQLVGGVSAPLVGVLVDRLGPRRLVQLGGLLLAVGLTGTAYATRLWHVVVLYGLVMTVGASFLGLVVFVPLLSRWFVQRRGMAISIVQSANGFARAISAPLAQTMVVLVGWRHAYLWQAGLIAVLVFPLAAVFRGTDAVTQPTVAGTPQPTSSVPSSSARTSWSLGAAMQTPHFWLLSAVYFFTGLGSFLVSLHQLAFAVDLGFDKLYAASVLGIGSGLAIVGTIVTGTLSDHIGRELSAILAYGISIVGVVCALVMSGPNHAWLLWLHASFFGLTWGARGPAVTAKTADLFPGPHLGAIVGVITIGSGLGSALGSWAAGLLFDVSGSYRIAFTLAIVSYVCGCVTFWAVRRPPRRPR